jgi:calcyphosin
MHPDVRSGKRTEDEVITEFIETFERHHAMYQDGKGRGDGRVTMEEFIEYYNNISCNIDNDSYFDLMISNAWNLSGTNPGSMPYAGTSKKVAQVNSREAYRQDHHRNLFGTDTSTPFDKGKKRINQEW